MYVNDSISMAANVREFRYKSRQLQLFTIYYIKFKHTDSVTSASDAEDSLQASSACISFDNFAIRQAIATNTSVN